MNLRNIVCAGGLWAAAVVGPAVAQTDQGFGVIERTIRQKWSQVKTLRANVTLVETGADGTIEGQMQGTYEYRLERGKAMSRMELRTTIIDQEGGKEVTIPITFTTYNDGSFAHVVRKRGDTITVTKAFANTQPTMDTNAILYVMRSSSLMEILPEETVHGKATFVIRATPLAPPPDVTSQVIYFAKETGVIVKAVTFDGSGTAASTYELSDVKINADIPKERFVVNVPKGAQVQDLTGTSQPYP
ncbi:MAG: hypothetical protein IIB57_12920 [Planctomycetes bacterium]|nr:hypothetical protein [Planctomycetota bacterium]